MDKLLSVKRSVWYDYLSGHYSYDEVCGILELLLIAKGALLKEEAQ